MGTLGGLTEGNELRKAREKWIYSPITVTPVTIICNRRKMKKYLAFLVNADFCCEILLNEGGLTLFSSLIAPSFIYLFFSLQVGK